MIIAYDMIIAGPKSKMVSECAKAATTTTNFASIALRADAAGKNLTRLPEHQLSEADVVKVVPQFDSTKATSISSGR